MINPSRARTALLLSVFFLLALSACSQEARAKRAFNRVEHEEISQFNKYNQRDVKPKIYESSGQFYKVYHEREDSNINIRRTNSLDTPYLATLSFTEHIYLTRKHPSWENCYKDSHFILSNSSKREIVYTYSGGSWRKKEIY